MKQVASGQHTVHCRQIVGMIIYHHRITTANQQAILSRTLSGSLLV